MSVCVTSSEFHFSLLYGTHKNFKTKHIRIFLLYANKSILKQQHLLSLLWLLPRSCCNNCEAMLSPKLYITSVINIKMSLIHFFFWAGCAVLGSTEISAILQKVSRSRNKIVMPKLLPKNERTNLFFYPEK